MSHESERIPILGGQPGKTTCNLSGVTWRRCLMHVLAAVCSILAAVIFFLAEEHLIPNKIFALLAAAFAFALSVCSKIREEETPRELQWCRKIVSVAAIFCSGVAVFFLSDFKEKKAHGHEADKAGFITAIFIMSFHVLNELLEGAELVVETARSSAHADAAQRAQNVYSDDEREEGSV